MTMVPREEDLDQADWVGEAERDGPGDFWRRHLGLQALRAVVALAILAMVLGLRAAGGPGDWALRRIGSALRAEFAPYAGRVFHSKGIAGILSAAKNWFRREWQVSGGDLASAAQEPPRLLPPVRDGRPMTGTEPGLGLDLQTPAGSPVMAAAAGTVTTRRADADGTWTIVLGHGGGWSTVYGRCQEPFIQTGEKAAAGQVMALVGSARPPVPAHLHFELRKDREEVDPRPYLQTVTGSSPVDAGVGVL